jgi:DNA mismatch endonuclease (patch repair protein)
MTSRDPEVTSRIMSAVRNSDTTPELRLRRELHRRGLRYRVTSTVLGKPDLVFPGPRVAVFVDGDWWHGNSWRLRGYPNFDSQFEDINNGDFWRRKIIKNMERDTYVTDSLQNEGWRVLRFWESDVLTNLDTVADGIESAIHTASRQRKHPIG